MEMYNMKKKQAMIDQRYGNELWTCVCLWKHVLRMGFTGKNVGDGPKLWKQLTNM